jgi:hypothetical protein
MNEYRAYLMGHDGHIRSSRAFVCEDDADAIVWAEQLADGHDIELWSGERFVRRVNAAGKPGVLSPEGDRRADSTEGVEPPQMVPCVTKKDNLSPKQPRDAKPSRQDEARQVAQEYADDQREIIKQLRPPHQLRDGHLNWRPLTSQMNVPAEAR